MTFSLHFDIQIVLNFWLHLCFPDLNLTPSLTRCVFGFYMDVRQLSIVSYICRCDLGISLTSWTGFRVSVSAGGLAVGRLGGEDLVSWTQEGDLGLLDTLEVAGWRDRTGGTGNTAVEQ